jgi:hypothetical protein
MTLFATTSQDDWLPKKHQIKAQTLLILLFATKEIVMFSAKKNFPHLSLSNGCIFTKTQLERSLQIFALIVILPAVLASCTTPPKSTVSNIQDENPLLQPAHLKQTLYLNKGEFDEVMRQFILDETQESKLLGQLKEIKKTKPPESLDAIFDLSTEERRQLLGKLEDQQINELSKVIDALHLSRKQYCKDRSPRLHSIGTKAILTFKKESPDQVLVIPIEGRDLHPRCVSFGLALAGQTLLDLKDSTNSYDNSFFKINRPTEDFPDRAKLILKNPLLKSIDSEDQIEVHVIIAQKDGITSKEERVVTYSSRKFTLYEKELYKKEVKKNKVKIHDLEAFPLPDEEVRKLYGPLVSDNYFVVNLSIRNTNKESKLISTGMIRAKGRAIVRPALKLGKSCFLEIFCWKTVDEEKLKTQFFTVPVSVVPNSATKMYTILDDEEVEQPRSKFFRSLTFIGALASAATTAYTGIAANKAANLFTGIFIPASKEALPDRWPGYKRNLVEKSMPDLLKIPARSVAGHKHLFFSKKKIDTLISDQNMFQPSFMKDYSTFSTPPFFNLVEMAYPIYAGGIDFASLENKVNKQGQPSVKVISLEFDQLDIPFEEVFEANDDEIDLIGLFQDLSTQVPDHIRLVNNIKDWYMRQNDFMRFGQTMLTFGELSKIKENVNDLLASKILKSKAPDFQPTLQKLQQIISEMTPKEGSFGSIEKDVELPSSYGLSRLNELQRDLDRLDRQRLSRSDLSPNFEKKINTIESTLKKSQSAVEWYQNLAKEIFEISTELLPKPVKDKKKRFNEWLADKEKNEDRINITDKITALTNRRNSIQKGDKSIALMKDSIWKSE